MNFHYSRHLLLLGYRQQLWIVSSMFLAGVLLACGDDDGPPTDAGTGGLDSGPVDSGPANDGGDQPDASLTTPIGPPWWPSEFGPDDEAGATNRITPAKVLEAVALMGGGAQPAQLYDLGRPMVAGMPHFANRTYKLTTPGAPTGGGLDGLGANHLVWFEDHIGSEIGQMGTQTDALGHIGVQVGEPGDGTEMHFYNGFTMADIYSPAGLTRLGVEKLRPIITRGILIDVEADKGRRLDAGEEITVADLEAALTTQGMSGDDILPGDAVLLKTGWESLWMVDNETYDSGAPGIGLEAAQWLAGKQVVLVGSDTWPVEVVPNPDGETGFIVHNELLTKNGILLQENLALAELAGDGVYEFGYIYSRIPFKGATGSPGAPVAIVGIDSAPPPPTPGPLPGGPADATPIGAEWWPGPWGAGDQAGATNWISPQKIQAALELVETGNVRELGREYVDGMPLFSVREYKMWAVGSPTGGPFGTNQLVYNEEWMSTEIGQVGTQIDGMGHVGVQVGTEGLLSEMRFYNGVTAADMLANGPYGLATNGVEHLRPILTRAIVIDVQAVKGRRLNAGEEILMADVQAALTAQGLTESDIEPGDAVLFKTGWGELWLVDNDTFNAGAPGIGMEVAQWLIARQVCLVGSDAWPVEVVPNPDMTQAFSVHNELQTKHGIPFLENMDLTPVTDEGVYQFALYFNRVALVGASGSPGAPLAIW